MGVGMLQVALDFTTLEKAVSLANQISGLGFSRLEAGTPLIKSVGMNAVRVLKEYGYPVVADMKTMDTGYLEVEMAATAGADLVSILGAAPDETVAGAVEAGKDYSVEIIGDLIGVKDPGKRAEELESLGVNEVLIHVGIDQQKKVSPLEFLDSVRKKVSGRLAVAGGLNPEKIREIGKRAQVFVVGGYITKAENPEKAVKDVLEAIAWE